MAIYGYARVSTEDQHLHLQLAALKAAGCVVIRSEKMSGTQAANRVELNTLLEFIREGDVLVVTRIDRLARSVKDLQDIVFLLKSRGASLRATEQPIDMSTPAGKAFLDMLGVFAEFETALRKERQMEGVNKAKKEGKYKGRVPKVDAETAKLIMSRVEAGENRSKIARELGIARITLYRIIGGAKDINKANGGEVSS